MRRRMDELYRFGADIRDICDELDAYKKKYEIQRIKSAKYYSFHMHRWSLGNRLDDQIQENQDALIGEFDGFCYSSRRANAIFRTLEDMVSDGIITGEEYNLCRI